MKTNLWFLIAMQAVTFVITLVFGLWIAMLHDRDPQDLTKIETRIDATGEPLELQKIGGLLVKVLEQRDSAFLSLRTTFLIFIGTFGFSAICNTLLAAAILRKFNWSGYEDPSVVLRTI